MSKRYWVTATAFGVALSALASVYIWSEYQIAREDYRSYQKGSEASQREAAWQIAEKCSFIFPEVSSFGECLWNEIKSYQHQDSTNKDLQAQQDMAIWAKWTFVTTAINLVLSALGLGALVYSLMLNREATRAAISASEAARDAVANERAWITLENRGVHTIENSTFGDIFISNGMAFAIHWQNAGRSPAINMRSIVDVQVIEATDSPRAFEFEEIPPDNRIAAIGPGTKFSTQFVLLNDDQTKRFREQSVRVFVYNQIVYNDVFTTKERRSEVCLEVTFRGPAIQGGERIDYITWEPWGSQNVAT